MRISRIRFRGLPRWRARILYMAEISPECSVWRNCELRLYLPWRQYHMHGLPFSCVSWRTRSTVQYISMTNSMSIDMDRIPDFCFAVRHKQMAASIALYSVRWQTMRRHPVELAIWCHSQNRPKDNYQDHSHYHQPPTRNLSRDQQTLNRMSTLYRAFWSDTKISLRWIREGFESLCQLLRLVERSLSTARSKFSE
jgi:hypothetical protein